MYGRDGAFGHSKFFRPIKGVEGEPTIMSNVGNAEDGRVGFFGQIGERGRIFSGVLNGSDIIAVKQNNTINHNSIINIFIISIFL